MAFTIRVTYADASVRSVDRVFPDLPAAAAFAIDLANAIGCTYTTYRDRPVLPVSVSVHDHAGMTIRIAVRDGGLLAGDGQAYLLDLPGLA